jgi:hypothetical protein
LAERKMFILKKYTLWTKFSWIKTGPYSGLQGRWKETSHSINFALIPN